MLISQIEALRNLLQKYIPMEQGQTVAIRAGRVITGDRTAAQVLTDQVVTVQDGLIAAIVPAEQYEATPDVRLIDASQSTLMPGLIETHCHVTGEWPHDPHATHLEAIPETRILRGLQDVWAVYSAGFTTMFSMGHGHPNYVAAIKEAINHDEMLGPRIYHCGWALSQTAGHGHAREWNYELVKQLRLRSAFGDGPWELRRMVRENLGCGADFTKLFSGEGGFTASTQISRRLDYTAEEIRAITDESHRLGFRVASHCMTLAHARHAAVNGVDRIEHGPTRYEPEFVPMLVETGASWCPTLSQLHWGLMEKEKRKLSAEQVGRIEGALEARCRMINEALDAGVVVGFGTDNRMRPKAGRQAIELKLMVDGGVPAADAIGIATSLAARLVGLEEYLGSIAPGKFADMILVNGDPIADISVLLNPDNVTAICKSYRRAQTAPPSSHYSEAFI